MKAEARSKAGVKVVLGATEDRPDDIHGMHAAEDSGNPGARRTTRAATPIFTERGMMTAESAFEDLHDGGVTGATAG